MFAILEEAKIAKLVKMDSSSPFLVDSKEFVFQNNWKIAISPVATVAAVTSMANFQNSIAYRTIFARPLR
jgi:hypothetical protein